MGSGLRRGQGGGRPCHSQGFLGLCSLCPLSSRGGGCLLMRELPLLREEVLPSQTWFTPRQHRARLRGRRLQEPALLNNMQQTYFSLSLFVVVVFCLFCLSVFGKHFILSSCIAFS